MSFPIPDLIIESIIRDGLADLKANPQHIDDVFADLAAPYASRKYGTAELATIKDLLTGANNTEIAIVHSFHETEGRTPCYSLQLGHTAEARELARLDDFEEDFTEPLSAADLAALVKETGVIPTSYDAITGQVRLLDSVDLADVFPSFIYEDGSGIEFSMGSISEVPGDKYFFITPQATPDIANPGLIKSFITEQQLEKRGVTDDVDILIGVHSKEALLTKYMFTLLQFFLLSRKADLISRCFFVSSLSGSDFNRDLAYQGDSVFTRFLTISGKIEVSWRSDMVTLIDSVNINGTPVE